MDMPRVRIKANNRKGRLVQSLQLGARIILIPTPRELAQDLGPKVTYYQHQEYELELWVTACVRHGFGSGRIMATVYLSNGTKAKLSILANDLRRISIGTEAYWYYEELRFETLETGYLPLS